MAQTKTASTQTGKKAPRTLAGTVPLAADSDRAQTLAMYEGAVRLMQEGKLDDACGKFDASVKLESSVGGLLSLADCRAATKHFASAWSVFLKAASVAHAANDPREAEAKKRAAELEPQLARLTINLEPDAAAIPDLRIAVDDVIQPRAALGTATPIDAGEHSIVASAPKHVRWETKFSVGAGDRNASVTVPALVVVAATEAPVEDAFTHALASSRADRMADESAPVERFHRRKGFRIGPTLGFDAGEQQYAGNIMPATQGSEYHKVSGQRVVLGGAAAYAMNPWVDLVGTLAFSYGDGTDVVDGFNGGGYTGSELVSIDVDARVHVRPTRTWWFVGFGLGFSNRFFTGPVEARANTGAGDTMPYAVTDIGASLFEDRFEVGVHLNVSTFSTTACDECSDSKPQFELGIAARYFGWSL